MIIVLHPNDYFPPLTNQTETKVMATVTQKETSLEGLYAAFPPLKLPQKDIPGPKLIEIK